MSARALILAYHAIEAGPRPLCMDPGLFAEHLDCLAQSEVPVVTLDRLGRDLRAGQLEGRSVAITFDDGFQSVIDEAVPLLAQRALPATIFCVAGHLGGHNDWPSQPQHVPRLRLAGAPALAALAGSSIQIGSHGMHHAPLRRADDGTLAQEIVASRSALEATVRAPVRWFAYPYGEGASAPARARRLLEAHYEGACSISARAFTADADGFALPRVDAHYLRRPALLRRVLEGLDVYLHARRAGGRLRRAVRTDHQAPGLH